MRKTCVLSLVLSAGSLLATPAPAQTIYRCGNSYSQTPCAGGSAIESGDSRDRTQKAQTDAAIRRDLKTAEALEKNRLKLEASRARAPRPYSDPASYDLSLQEASSEYTYEGGRKTRKSEFFTAKTMGEPHPKKKAGAPAQGAPGQDKPGTYRP